MFSFSKKEVEIHNTFLIEVKPGCQKPADGLAGEITTPS